MTEIATLFARSRRYLDSAALLSRTADYESSVSRSYYAMFYAAQAALLSKNLTCFSHKSVISSFEEQFVKTDVFPRAMGRQLNLAYQKRQLGDYEAAFVLSKEDAENLHDEALRFVDAVSQYLQGQGLLDSPLGSDG
jgi:uncharacterized protein (UPF0332 family)